MPLPSIDEDEDCHIEHAETASPGNEPSQRPQGPSQGRRSRSHNVVSRFFNPDASSSSSSSSARQDDPDNASHSIRHHLGFFSRQQESSQGRRQRSQSFAEIYFRPAASSSSSSTRQHPSSSTPLNQNQSPQVHPRASSAGVRNDRPFERVILPAPDAYAGSCTHGVMEIEHVHGHRFTCDACRKEPFFGWLYRCKMDQWAAKYNSADEPFLSPWLMKAIEEGKYTDDQISIVYQQKEDVVERVDAFRNASPDSEIDPFYLEGRHPDLRKPEEERKWVRERPPCHYRVCHSCRSHYEHRAYISLDTVCNEPNIRPPSLAEVANLHVVDANICRNLLVDRPPIRIREDVKEDAESDAEEDVKEDAEEDAKEDANPEHRPEGEVQEQGSLEGRNINARLEELLVMQRACHAFLVELEGYLTGNEDNITAQSGGGN